jgi:hypothetical protein
MLIVGQIIKNFSTFDGSVRFIIVFSETLSWARWIQYNIRTITTCFLDIGFCIIQPYKPKSTEVCLPFMFPDKYRVQFLYANTSESYSTCSSLSEMSRVHGFNSQRLRSYLQKLKLIWTTQHDYTRTYSVRGTPHSSRHVTVCLNEQFPDRWIGRDCPQNSPLRSPNLTLQDFHVRGYMKKRLYKRKVNRGEELWLINESSMLQDAWLTVMFYANFKSSWFQISVTPNRWESNLCSYEISDWALSKE